MKSFKLRTFTGVKRIVSRDFEALFGVIVYELFSTVAHVAHVRENSKYGVTIAHLYNVLGLSLYRHSKQKQILLRKWHFCVIPVAKHTKL
jgi:hypothetical protein